MGGCRSDREKEFLKTQDEHDRLNQERERR